MNLLGRCLLCSATLCFVLIGSAAHAQNEYGADCKPIFVQGRHGPFDYRTATPDQRYLVEGAHFDVEFAAFRAGKARAYRPNIGPFFPASGFSYTLWAFPNHPQALAAMDELGIRNKTEKPQGAELRVECYFQRAVRFAENDSSVRVLFGYYYARRGKPDKAKSELEIANQLGPESLNVQVYSANAYFEMKEFGLAELHAKKAYALGYTLPGLREKLRKSGHWTE